ncbi:MAG TPA: hypothetical protein VJG83_00570 [archaeon]|nr:hypothetical protein [archaeon]
MHHRNGKRAEGIKTPYGQKPTKCAFMGSIAQTGATILFSTSVPDA